MEEVKADHVCKVLVLGLRNDMCYGDWLGDRERGWVDWFLEVPGGWGGLGGGEELVTGLGKSHCQIPVILP